jgi:excisionase family DNA binding protein
MIIDKGMIMDKIFLNHDEAAELLRISKPTLDRYIAQGKIPSYKIEGRRIFDRDELIKWVRSHRSDRPKRAGEKKKSGLTSMKP